MGRHERIVGEDGIPMRRVVLPQDGGGEREFWLPDVSDPVFQATIRSQAKALAASPSYWNDIAWAESVQADALDGADRS